MIDKKKQEKFNNLINDIIFIFPKVWDYSSDERKNIFKKAIKFVHITIESDTNEFFNNLKKATSFKTYNKEARSVGEVLLKWRNRQ